MIVNVETEKKYECMEGVGNVQEEELKEDATLDEMENILMEIKNGKW